MAQPMGMIDLTQDDDGSDGDESLKPCGNPHHAVLLDAMRRQLHEKRQEIVELEQRIETRDATITDRQHIIAELHTRDADRVADITRLQGQVTTLQDKLNGRGKRHKRTWPDKLKAFIVDGNREISYSDIHTLCCKEENMSTSTTYTHPYIRLCASSNGWRADAVNLPQRQNDTTFAWFHCLPAEVQAEIFRLWLHKGRPIHCFSRLNPFMAPGSWPVSNSAGGMYNRFYWGNEKLLDLTADAVDPQEVLGLLLVSKDFYFKGVHAFYGLNTFAFSSIGEFGRFCKGIGHQRAARLQFVELTWTGSQYLTAGRTSETSRTGKTVEKWNSVRTRPFSFLLELRRLRTLDIFLDESGPLYERRKYEPTETKAKLLGRTALQPNFRGNRSLRTLQGLDYVCALRGLDSVRLYDLHRMSQDVSPVTGFHPIRDTSFVADVNSAVTMPKSAQEGRNCQLKNLPRLFPSKENAPAEEAEAQNMANPMKPWDPSNVDWSTIQYFYDDTQWTEANPYSSTRTYYGVRDLNAPVDEDDGGGPLNDNADRDNNNADRDNDNAGRGNDSERGNGPNGGDVAGSSRNRDPDNDGGEDRHNHNHGNHGNHSLFVHNDDDDIQHQQHGRHNAEAGPSRQNGNSRPPPQAFHGSVLQPRSAANLNSNAGPSRANGQKRSSNNAGRPQAKRQKVGDTDTFPARRDGDTFEQLTREYLGSLTSCASIASLLNPFADNLIRRDWKMVKRILQRNEARQSERNLRRLVEIEGQLPGEKSSAKRIIQALLA